MKNARIIVCVWFFAITGVLVVVSTISKVTLNPALAAKQMILEQARVELQLQHLERNDAAWFYGGLSFAGVIGLSVLVVAFGVHRAQIKRASVHTYKFSGGTEVVIHEKDLSVAWQIVTGLTNAEELKAMNGGLDKALQLYTTMADVQSRQIQALLGKRGLQPALPEAPTPLPITPPPTVEKIPTFQELLLRGEIAPGKPMILGYANGVPRRGSFLDIYSAAIAGESGSGKTITLLFLIGSGIVAFQVRFIVIDPHDPHPKALGPKIKPLVNNGMITLATKKAGALRRASISCRS
jgi:hypothetical protein